MGNEAISCQTSEPPNIQRRVVELICRGTGLHVTLTVLPANSHPRVGSSFSLWGTLLVFSIPLAPQRSKEWPFALARTHAFARRIAVTVTTVGLSADPTRLGLERSRPMPGQRPLGV